MKAKWHGRTMRLTPAFILGLVFGGPVKPTLPNPNTPSDMNGFDDADLQLVVDEGRRQLDNQTGAFQHVQGRAQSLLTICLAVLAFATGAIGRLQKICGARFVVALIVFVMAMSLVIIGLALAAAVIVVRADFDQTDTTQITGFDRPLLKSVAADYADVVRIGEITIAARVTLFRMATRYTVCGAVLTAAVYALTK